MDRLYQAWAAWRSWIQSLVFAHITLTNNKFPKVTVACIDKWVDGMKVTAHFNQSIKFDFNHLIVLCPSTPPPILGFVPAVGVNIPLVCCSIQFLPWRAISGTRHCSLIRFTPLQPCKRNENDTVHASAPFQNQSYVKCVRTHIVHAPTERS